MAVIKRDLATLLRDNKGNVLPIAAVALMVTATIVGGGVDLSRAYRVQNRLQYACDSAVLAGRKSVSTAGFDTAVQTTATSYFNANFDSAALGASNTTFSSASPNNGQTINGTATAKVNSIVVRVIGLDDFNLRTTCSASMGVGNSDVTMVLDVTGSMDDPITSGGSSKITMLRSAMKSFYDTVAAATAGTNARVRYSFVPYSSGVNVGRLLQEANPNWLVDSYAIQSRRPVYKTVQVQEQSGWGAPVYSTGSGTSSETLDSNTVYSTTQYSGRTSCNNARPANIDWANNGNTREETDVSVDSMGRQVTTVATIQPQVRTKYVCVKYTGSTTYYLQHAQVYEREVYSYNYATRSPTYITVPQAQFDYWQYEQRTYDTSSYKNFNPVTLPNGTDGANQTSTWAGCIEERSTVSEATFTAVGSTITPAGATDLDIDSAPVNSNNATKWAPMWPELAYYRLAWVASGYGGSWQVTNAATSLNGQKASSYCPKAAKLLSTMSESEFDTYTDALRADGNTYHDIGLIWGARLSSPQGLFSSVVTQAPANGGEVARHIIFMTDGQLATNNKMQTTYGIEFHDRRITDDGSTNQNARHAARYQAMCQAIRAKGIRIWVIAFSTGLTTELENCASDNSSFTANSATELNNAFQSIAKQVGELRIVQ